MNQKPSHQLTKIYQFAQLILILMILGLSIELFFIAHYENFWQYLPFLVLVVSLVSIWLVLKNKLLVLVKFAFLMVILTGFLGVYLHLKSNLEFELEMYPNIQWKDLLAQSLTGALPVLAPGSLFTVGLLRLLLLKIKTTLINQSNES
jgi:hypothetical protein